MYTNPSVVGYMKMPVSFPHRSLFMQGRPRHEKFDSFWRKHPPMDATRRAKIFSPFDALAGFDECIAAKLVQYQEKRVLSEEERSEVDSALSLLHSLTYNGRVARANRPRAAVTYFVPCTDPNSEWFGIGGRYETVSGIVEKVDNIVSNAITINGLRIALDDIAEIHMSDKILPRRSTT